MKILKENFLSLIVFLTGASILVVEVVATRILSPYFGNTIYTYSSVISVILGALSLGYYIGGKLSDRKAILEIFYSLIGAGGLLLLSFHLISYYALPYFGQNLSISTGPLVTSIFLFFLPAVILGMLSPYSIKLQSLLTPEQGLGSITGKMFFWSTVGSILGSLSAGFILIPNFGVSNIMIYNGLFLSCLGLIPLLLLKKNFKSVLMLGLVFGLFQVGLYFFNIKNTQLLYSKDGVYEKLSIVDFVLNGRPVRFFKQDLSVSSAMYLDSEDPNDLALDYSKYLDIKKFSNAETENIYIIGGGTYSVPKSFSKTYPAAKIDVVDIEPDLYKLSQEFFKLDDSYTNIFPLVGDGRNLITKTDNKYDIILGDAYGSIYSVPSHLVTVEFFQLLKSRLSDDGIVMLNIIGNLSKNKSDFLKSEVKTFKQVFPYSYFLAVESPASSNTQNFIFIGLNDVTKFDAEAFKKDEKYSSKLLDFYDLDKYHLLTDDFSPVDYLVSKSLD